MKKEVLISISNFQYEVDQEESVEVVTTGTYYEKNGKAFVRYEEVSDDGKVTKNTIKIEQGRLELIKRGESNAHMVFEPEKENRTYYTTPYGEILVQINTTSLTIQEGDSIRVKIVYDLYMNDTRISECHIDIGICSKENTV